MNDFIIRIQQSLSDLRYNEISSTKFEEANVQFLEFIVNMLAKGYYHRMSLP